MKAPEYVTDSEWDRLSELQRQFICEAASGGLRYLVNDDGSVCAWGPGVACIFSMEVSIQKNPFDGYVVTLPQKAGAS